MRILLVKLSSLGDVVQTTPVVHDILQQMPQAQIDWVVEEAFAPLLQRVQGINRVIPIAQRRWRTLARGEKHALKAQFLQELQHDAYDAVIDCQGLIKSALVARQARLTPTGKRYGFGNRSALCSYEWPVRFMVHVPIAMPTRIHAIARTRRLVTHALGLPERALYTRAQTRWHTHPHAAVPQTHHPFILLAHGSTRADNAWEYERWLRLSRLLLRQGAHLLLPQSGALEASFVQRLQNDLGSDAARTTALNPMPLDALLDVMSACSAVIGMDSGLAHMAVSLDKVVLMLFAQPRVARAGPVGRAYQQAVIGAAPGYGAPSFAGVWHAWCSVCAAQPASLPRPLALGAPLD